MRRQIIAVIVILIGTAIGWQVLASVMYLRTHDRSASMGDAVGELWGGSHSQVAPKATASWTEIKRIPMDAKERADFLHAKQEEEKAAADLQHRPTKKISLREEDYVKEVPEPHARSLELDSSKIGVDLSLDYRRKGLLWFSTYKVGYEAVYFIANPENQSVAVAFDFPFSCLGAVYDNMQMTAPGRTDLQVVAKDGALHGEFLLPPHSTQEVRVAYLTRGLDEWTYRLGSDARIVKNFSLTMRTDFRAIDFPQNSISPDSKLSTAKGWELKWDKSSLVSALSAGMLLPHRINPGPLAAQMSAGAPVSLLFYFFLLVMLQCIRGLRIHPMHYFFLAASFFSFNLLFSYMVDHVDLVWAFGICSAMALLIVVPYMARVVGVRFAVLQAGIGQIVYQLIFSFAYFFDGYTGLTITIGAILTLVVAMHLTAKVDWQTRFARAAAPSLTAATPVQG
jgi:hypothetical protein